jgi:transcriptional regulator with XRE-family HTH domain
MKGEFDAARDAAMVEAVGSLKKIREALGWTQRQLGEEMGLPAKTAQAKVSDWEMGRRPISYNLLQKMAAALGQEADAKVVISLAPIKKT